MKKELVLERVQNQTRLAVLEDGRLCEIYHQRGDKGKLAGNIYAGRVQNILPGMNAAFVDIGLAKNAFLYAGDIRIDVRDQAELQSQLENARIERMLRPGQMIVAQVIKEPGGSKGPRLSGSMSLPGRLSVLLPTLKYAGVSKKITDSAERDRLYAIAQELSHQYGAGVIIRTAAEGVSKEALAADYARILKDWQRIQAEASHSAQPRLIQSDGDLALLAVREMLDEGISSVRTDDTETYDRLMACARALTPHLADRIALHKSETPLFDLLRIDRQLDVAFDRRVHLKSGGTLVIDETEALTVIDVNTAKFTGKKSLEETIYQLNCEAADEIARQLRLRDLGGIIIVDFIDMADPARRDALLDHLRLALANDPNRTSVLGMTSLGLVEMTRKKERQPISRLLQRECPCCQGAGREWTHESVAYRAVRDLWRRRRMGDTTAYRIETGAQVADWMQKIGLPEGRARIVARGNGRDYEIIPDIDSRGKEETL